MSETSSIFSPRETIQGDLELALSQVVTSGNSDCEQRQLKKIFGTRRFMFTMHNYQHTDVAQWQEWLKIRGSPFYVLGFELAPRMKVWHIQGYFELPKDTTFATIRMQLNKKVLSNNFHIEAAKESRNKCVAYCTKDNYYLMYKK